MIYIHKPSLIQTKVDADKLYDEVIKEINTAVVKGK
jgi:hypothetical protein